MDLTVVRWSPSARRPEELSTATRTRSDEIEPGVWAVAAGSGGVPAA
ncbi:hypothetical protein [Actinomadura sp. DC4]|nr:hypothetical protein [Actinomadura sp. DC4]MDN3359846.1 hypothetical protein [Actinomadura sp. DC4]